MSERKVMQLSRNVIWNTLGSLVPVLAGMAVVPLIVERLGVERFGVLSGVWMLIGYFTVFDLGLGRTLTKLTADKLSQGLETEIPPLISTTLLIVAFSSTVLSCLVLLGAGWISSSVSNAEPAIASEVTAAIRWLAMGLPFVVLATAFTGVLEAFQKFAAINAVRVPMGTLTYVIPVSVLPFVNDLAVVTAFLALVRIANAAVLALICLRTVPRLRHEISRFSTKLVRPLLTFGGWLTVSNVVGPLMLYFDRFLIAAALGSAALAYYTVPYDVLTRLWIFPTAVQGVLFPAFVMMRNRSSPNLIAAFARSTQATLLLLSPAAVATLLLAAEGLSLWVGTEFATNSAKVAAVLAIGVLVNAMTRTPFAFVQSAGYARWTAVVHLVELPLYAALLWWSLREWGILGAAYAWTARMIFDALVFYVLAVRLDRRLMDTALRDAVLVAGIFASIALVQSAVPNLVTRALIAAIICLVCGSALLMRLKYAVLPRPPAVPSS